MNWAFAPQLSVLIPQRKKELSIYQYKLTNVSNAANQFFVVPITPTQNSNQKMFDLLYVIFPGVRDTWSVRDPRLLCTGIAVLWSISNMWQHMALTPRWQVRLISGLHSRYVILAVDFYEEVRLSSARAEQFWRKELYTTLRWDTTDMHRLASISMIVTDALGPIRLRNCKFYSKIFSRNLCIAEIVVHMRISSWNFVRVPKAMLWAHVQSFSLSFSSSMWLLALYIFARLFWRDRETLVKQPPGHSQRPCWLDWGRYGVIHIAQLELCYAYQTNYNRGRSVFTILQRSQRGSELRKLTICNSMFHMTTNIWGQNGISDVWTQARCGSIFTVSRPLDFYTLYRFPW